jgi:HPt (histidine-containing phosphotransfer) domain-containing protein
MTYVTEMQRAVDREDWNTVQLRARAIRGAAHMIGAPHLVAACSAIIATTTQALPDEWPTLSADLHAALDQARSALTTMFGTAALPPE